MSEIQDDAVKNLFAKIWEACSDMTGYAAAPNEFKNYLYCSDLGQLPNP